MKNRERIIFIGLAVILLVIATIISSGRLRSYHKIVIVKNGVKEQFTLNEVERMLREAKKIDINTASEKEISSIPGIGEVLATRIVKYREAHGNFYQANDLLNVAGIGKKKLGKIKAYIAVRG